MSSIIRNGQVIVKVNNIHSITLKKRRFMFRYPNYPWKLQLNMNSIMDSPYIRYYNNKEDAENDMNYLTKYMDKQTNLLKSWQNKFKE